MAWYPLNGDLKDYVGGNDLLNSNSSVIVSNSNGKIGKCYEDLTTSWACLEAKDPIQLPQTHSMFCWVCPEVLTSDCSLDGVLGNHNYNIPANTGITLRYVSATTYRVSLNTANTNRARTYNTYYGDTLLNINEWHHIGFTYDGTTIKLYVDGKLDKTVSYSDMNLTSEKFRIFSWSTTFNNNDYCGKKKINDVRIYDHCLSEAEVKEISKAKILHYKFDEVGASENFILMSDKVTGSIVASGITRTFMEDGSLKVVSASGNGNWCTLGFAKNSNYNVGQKMSVGDKYTVSCDIKVEEGQRFPTLFINNGNGYRGLLGDITKKNVWQRVYYTSTWNEPRYTIW